MRVAPQPTGERLCARANRRLIAVDLMDAATRSCLGEIARDVTREEDALLKRSLGVAASAAREIAGHWAFEAPSKAIDHWISDSFPGCNGEAVTRLRTAVVARLAIEHFQAEHQLPASVLELYPAFFDRLARFLSNKARHGYKPDFYCKDVRYALGLTVPCGLVQIDLRYRIGPKLVLRDVMQSGSLRAGWDYASSRGWGGWYNTHIDAREMGCFNPEGWTASFLHIARLLEVNRQICGVVGVSWYYDPAVSEISPELAYLRRNQTDNGAYSLRLGPGPHDLRNALFGSRIRQQLYKDGKYIPTSFLIAWPRKSLTAWARCLSSGRDFLPAEARELVIP